jgi:hypothetical protein
MDRSPALRRPLLSATSLLLVLVTLVPSTGCLHMLLASGIYLWQGGNVVPAECTALEEKRVVVVCRPPASSDFSLAGASRQLNRAISMLLKQNVKKIDIVDPREVDTWLDESDTGDYVDLGRAVKADIVLVVDMERFDLYKGRTLYQGNADVSLQVHDMSAGGELIWDRQIGQVLFPRNAPIPAADKSQDQFQREFVAILANQIAIHFYKHDPSANFAIDALANR